MSIVYLPTIYQVDNNEPLTHTHTQLNNRLTINAPYTNKFNECLCVYGDIPNGKTNLIRLGKDSTDLSSAQLEFAYGGKKNTANYFAIGFSWHDTLYRFYVDHAVFTKRLDVPALTVNGVNITTQSTTITHNCPVSEDINNFHLGYPVFSSGQVFNYENGEWTNNIDSVNCIPSVKSNGTYHEFLGIIVKINSEPQQTTSTNEEEEEEPEPFTPTIDFATHGDYLFHVNNSSNYSVGNVLTYDGTIIADDTFINVLIMTSIIGKITAIIDEHTVSVFKS